MELEGIDSVVQDVVAEQRLERPSVHRVAGAIENLIDVELQPGVLKDPHGPVRIEIDQHIDIAARLGLASPRATEPNTAAWDAPSRFNSLSWVRKVRRTSLSTPVIFQPCGKAHRKSASERRVRKGASA